MPIDQVPIVGRRQFLKLGAVALTLPLIPRVARADANATMDNALGIGRNQPFDFGWKFNRSDKKGQEGLEVDDRLWRDVNLPHDWSIEDLSPEAGSFPIGPFTKDSLGGTATAFTLGGEGWYRKHFQLAGRSKPGKVEVLFDGIYMESDVWLNGQHLGRRVHGYAPFAYDLTPYLNNEGDNVLAVRVLNNGKNSRWYSGSGIYRSVKINVMSQPTHIQRWGVAVSTLRLIGDSAEVQVDTSIELSSAEYALTTLIKDSAGKKVAEHSLVASEQVQQRLTVKTVQLWSPDMPALYSVESELRHQGQLVDKVVTPFGVRVISLDSSRGLNLNGVQTKLRGGCIHHDNGLLGAAAFQDAEDRKVRLLKARGYNAIRSSHYPCSEAFANACDKHGMLLIEEAFDMWRWPKNPQDYSTYFEENWKADLSAMVLSARNHPSVIMWSIGNEIPNRSSAEGIETSWELANEVHRIDPTRPVTAAVHAFAGRPVIASEASARRGFSGKLDEPACVFLDVVGYNYKLDRYEDDHTRFPERIIYGSESFPYQLFDIWSFVNTHAYVIGDFVWTAMDYLGEAGVGDVARTKTKRPPMMVSRWPTIISNCGDLDLTGHQKAPSYARDVVWGVSQLEMAVQRPLPADTFEYPSLWGWSDELQSWTWPGSEGQPLKVRVYTRADRVEMRLNGRLIDSQVRLWGQKPLLEFHIPYEAGSLEAIAYEGETQVAHKRFETAGNPAAIRITPESRDGGLLPNGLSYLWIEVIDSSGRIVPDTSMTIALRIDGPAKLAGFGSANPRAVGSFQSTQAQSFGGRALAILRSSGGRGLIKIEAHSGILAPGRTVINSV